MDIGGLNTDYQNYMSRSSEASAKMNQIQKTDYANATDEELMNACKQFEEYFVEMTLKEVFKTVDMFGMGESEGRYGAEIFGEDNRGSKFRAGAATL